MKPFAWIYERSRMFLADMQRTGSRAWRAVCRTDEKLEIAFYRMIVVVMLLLAPPIGALAVLIGALAVLIGMVIGIVKIGYALLKSAYSHRPWRSDQGDL